MKKLVDSNKVFTPTEFIDTYCPGCKGLLESEKYDDFVKCLDEHGYEDLWDFPLAEIDEIFENDNMVVLVHFPDDYLYDYRWVETGEIYKED